MGAHFILPEALQLEPVPDAQPQRNFSPRLGLPQITCEQLRIKCWEKKKKKQRIFKINVTLRGHALSYCARCQYMFMNHQIITWHRNTLSCSITWASRWYFLSTIYDLERCNSLYSYIMHAIVHGRLDIKRNKWFTAQACIIMPRSATERTSKA